MKKVFLIGWKDLLLAYRDRAALIFMLVTPFLLTLGLGLITGRLSGGSAAGINNIPVIVVDLDGNELGHALVDVFYSTDLDTLIDPTTVTDASSARSAVDEDQAAAAVVIPAGFTDSIFSAAGEDVVPIEIYSNPTRPTGTAVVRSIVETFLNHTEFGRINARVVVNQLLEAGYIEPAQAAQAGAEIGTRSAANAGESPITLRGQTEQESDDPPFDILAYMAPGMALMFLMFTVSNGGRTILSEKIGGTLPRLLVAPVTMAQVMAGKALGIYLTGVLQMLILIGGTALLFGIYWGDWVAVIVLILAAVFGALGWGMLLTAVAKTPNQVANTGSILMLTFGILSGAFTNPESIPGWLRTISHITPNAWALDGFSALAFGARLPEILGPIAGLLAMGLALFSLTVFLFLRRGGLER